MTRLGIGLAAAAIVAVVAVALPLLPRTIPGTGADPRPSASVDPTRGPSPSSRPSPSTLSLDVAVGGGIYTVSVGTDVPTFVFDITLPAGWIPRKLASSDVAFAASSSEVFPSLSFFTIDRVYEDPCHPESGYQGGYLGRSNADDVELELRRLKGFDATTPTTVKVGGHDARAFVLSNTIDSDASGCTAGGLLPLFVTDDVQNRNTEPSELEFSPATNGGTTLHVWIVNRALWPLLIVGEVDPADPGTQLAAIQEIIDSIEIR